MLLSPNHPRDTIHLALSPWNLADDYNRHAGVTLLSFLDHCDRDTHVVVHLLYEYKFSIGKEQETKYNKSCYQKIADMFNCEIQYHQIELPDWINSIPAIKIFTPGTILRLYLPDILPDVDKIIYLDCDVVVLTSINKLWEIPLENYYIAGCIDKAFISSAGIKRRYWHVRGIPTDKYFNAGILLLNLKKIRLETPDFSSKLMKHLYDTPDLLLLDQDLLNWFCQGDFYILNEKYNVFSERSDALEFVNDCILHYSSKGKPWKRYGGKIDNYYWKYLVLVPWAENKNQLINYLRDAPDISKCFKVIPEYFNHQEGKTYLEIAGMMITLSLCLPWKIIRGVYILIKYKIMSWGHTKL